MATDNYKFDSPDEQSVFPLELVRNGGFFRARVQQSGPLWFLIDSGAGTTYIDSDVAQRIGLKSEGKTWVQGAGTGKVEVDVYPRIVFQLPGLRTWDHRVHGVSLFNVSGQWGRPLHGFFGHDFLSRFTVTIDYPKRQIMIEESSRFKYTGPGTTIPIEFKGPLPYIRAEIQVPGNPLVEDLFLVDSGSQDEVDHPLIAKSNVETQPAAGGIGLGTPSRARLGLVELLKLGPFQIRGATGVATEAGLGSKLIGGGVLSRFKVVFDYQRERIILESMLN